MTFTLGLAQTLGNEGYDPLEDARRFCAQASEAGVDLLVFPESLMTPFEIGVEEFIASAQDADGTFASSMNALAAEYGLWIVYTMNEKAKEDQKPFNTAVLVDSSGRRRALYRKTHLFDSSTHTESEKMSAGSDVFPIFEAPFARIGIGICYDLRFPEYARCEALEGCELLLYPAAWVDGPLKADQWKTLLAARAIENSIFVAGVSRAGDDYVGESFVFAPDGTELAKARKKARDLVVAEIDAKRIGTMRRAIPSLEHRRPELYARISAESHRKEAHR